MVQRRAKRKNWLMDCNSRVGHGDGAAEGSGDVDRNWEMSSSRYASLITCIAMGCRA